MLFKALRARIIIVEALRVSVSIVLGGIIETWNSQLPPPDMVISCCHMSKSRVSKLS